MGLERLLAVSLKALEAHGAWASVQVTFASWSASWSGSFEIQIVTGVAVMRVGMIARLTIASWAQGTGECL